MYAAENDVDIANGNSNKEAYEQAQEASDQLYNDYLHFLQKKYAPNTGVVGLSQVPKIDPSTLTDLNHVARLQKADLDPRYSPMP